MSRSWNCLGLVVPISVMMVLIIGVTTSTGAAADTWTGGPVAVRVELDSPSKSGLGPKVFERTGVIPGAGYELTSADEIANPSNWCGGLSVDIDPVAHTVVLADPYDHETLCAVQTVKISITGASFTEFTVQSSNLFKIWVLVGVPLGDLPTTTELAPIPSMKLVAITAGSTGAQAEWAIDPADATAWLDGTGSVVFRYALSTPTGDGAPSTTAPSTTVATTRSSKVAAPTTAAVANPVDSAPTYTG